MSDPIVIPVETTFNPRGTDQAEAALGRLAREQARTAKAQNEAALSAQRFATEQARTSRELSNAAAAASRAESAAMRLARAQSDAAAGGSKLSRAISGMQAAFGAAGIALGTQQIVAFAAASIDLANKTETSMNALRALAGSTELYNEAIAAAKAQQRLFGGSLQENIDGIQGLITVSRSSGVELNKLIDITQRLSIKDPAQGARGARIALNEALSGDPTSLAKRYEIPRAALAAIRDESVSTADKLVILDKYLNDIGITSEVAAGSVSKNTIAYNELGQAAEQAQLKIGAALSEGLAPAATGLTYILNLTTGVQDFDAALPTLVDGLVNVSQQLAMFGSNGAQVEQMLRLFGVEMTTGGETAKGFADWLVNLVTRQDEAAAAAQRAANADALGSQRKGEQTEATREATGATESESASLVEATEQKLKSAIAAKDLAAFQADLAAQASGVAGGHLTVGAAALILAAKWGVAAEEAERLIRLQNQLGGAPGGAGLAGTRGNQRLTYAQQRDAREQRMAGAGPQEAGTVANLYVEQQQAAAQKVLDARKEAEKEAERAAKAGGAARVNAEQRAGDRIVDLARDTAAKLVEIDRRAAEQRAEAARQLAADIATTTADLVANQEANDLELVGASEEERARLAAREQAEANARIAAAKAVEEAKATAAGGDAQLAQDQYQIRQEQIAAQQQLDQDYYERRSELGEEDQAALKEQYDQATKAAAEATQVRMDLAAAEAQQRQDQLAAEKQAVLDDAAARAEAMDSTGKSAMSAKELVDKLDEALRSLPTQVSTTVTVNEVRTSGGESSGGGGGSNAKAAGGGSFVTSGPTRFTVGDNPGGRELVSVIPLSGAGRSSVHGPNVSMAGGGVVDVAAEEAERRLRNAPGGPAMPTAGGGATTRSAAQAAARAEEAAKPAIADYAKAVKENVEVLSDVLRLRMALNDPATWTPIPIDMITSVVNDADQVGRAFAQVASTYDSKVLEGAKLYTDALQGTYQVIKDGVETFDALRIAELLPADKLAAFEASSRAVIDTVGRLGSQAATIGDVTALSNVAGAMALLPALGMGGGSTTNTTMGGVNINIYAQPGQDVNMIADAVMRRLGQSVGARRY